MFERFRIKSALRGQVIALRGQGLDPDALARAELLFFEPAFHVAPEMKRRRWTPDQAMVVMVTDVLLAAQDQGKLAACRRDDPPAYAALHAIHRRILALAEADPALAPCISRPDPGQTAPFSDLETT